MLRLLVLADREPLHYRCQEPQQTGSELKDRRYQGQNGHGVHLPPSVPLSGASGGKGCGAAPPLRFVPLSIATAYHAQMARIQRGSSSISRASDALATRIPRFSPAFPTRFPRECDARLAHIRSGCAQSSQARRSSAKTKGRLTRSIRAACRGEVASSYKIGRAHV